MAKAYLCPHCNTRNKFRPTDIIDGVARCGACAQAFMLPDYKPTGSRSRQVTALVDNRGDIPSLPPTLTRTNTPLDPRRARAETLIVGDVPTPMTKAPRNHVNVVVNMPENIVPEPPSVSMHDRPTIRSSDVPSLSLLEETPASSASTQPTSPPPEFRSLETNEDSAYSNAFETTQPSHSTKASTRRWWLLTSVVSVICGLASTATLEWLGSAAQTVSDSQWVQSTQERATAITRSANRLIADSQPASILPIIQSHPDVTITSPSGRYFLTNEESATYLNSIKTTEPTKAEVAIQTDSQKSELARDTTDDTTCFSRPKDSTRNINHTLTNNPNAGAPGHVEQWQQETNRYVAVPLISVRKCTGCYGRIDSGDILTWIVISGPLPQPTFIQKLSLRDLAPIAGGAVALFVFMIAISLRRQRTA